MVGLSEQRGCLFLRHADGVEETLAKPEVDSQIAAFVTRVILNPAYHGPRTAPKPATPMAIPLRL